MAGAESSRILQVGSTHARRFRSSLSFPPPPRPSLLGFHAHHLFAARQNRNLNWIKIMNSASLVPIEFPPLPPHLVIRWRCFSFGLRRVPEGAIQVACCVGAFPKVKVFTHAGRCYANCGGYFSGLICAVSDCDPRIPAGGHHGPKLHRLLVGALESPQRETSPSLCNTSSLLFGRGSWPS